MPDAFNIDSLDENCTVKKQMSSFNSSNPINYGPEYCNNNRISLDITYMLNSPSGPPFISLQELDKLSQNIILINRALLDNQGDCLDNNIPMLGWQSLPERITDEHIAEIISAADSLAAKIDSLVSLGIGGSYLGLEAAFKSLTHSYFNQLDRAQRGGRPQIYFLGQNLDPDYFRDTLDMLRGRRVGVNVISKSGTTLETAIAFRIIKDLMEKSFGKHSADLIFATTDKTRGALKKISKLEGYKNFEIPDDIGGRFSIMTDVGLFGLAVAGINIREFVAGFRHMKTIADSPEFWNNPAMIHAAIRHLSYQKGKKIEVVAVNSAAIYQITRWMEQLFPESEGHSGRGLWVSPAMYSEKLHANGQMIQDGERNVFETFLQLARYDNNLAIPTVPADTEGLNYLPQKNLDLNRLNDLVIQGPALAHFIGGVPNMTFKIPSRSAFNLGQFFYLMEKSVAISGYLAGHNPFIQPGVEAYKKALFALAGKPGTESEKMKIDTQINSLERLII